METNNITFGANYIMPARVKKGVKILNYNMYFPSKASFVQIDFNNEQDVKVLSRLKDIWKGANFLQCISTIKYPKREKVYALTAQQKNFDNLEPSKILGLVKTSDFFCKDGEILYLQVNPANINIGDDKKPFYKKCGTAILDSLKKLYNRIQLTSADDVDVENFYLCNEFRNIDNWYGRYIWEKNADKNADVLTNFLNESRNKTYGE